MYINCIQYTKVCEICYDMHTVNKDNQWRYTDMKKNWMTLILSLVLVFALTSSASAATFLSIATGGTTGTY